MAEQFISNVSAVLEIQSGVGNGNRGVVDVSSSVKPALGGFTKSFGAITRNYRISARTNRPVPRPVRRDNPDPITAELTTKMIAVNYLETLDEDSRFVLYVRHPARYPNNPLDYARVDILSDVAVESFQYGDLVSDENNTDDVVLTVPVNAAAHLTVRPVEGVRIETGMSAANDTDVTAAIVDEDGVIYAVTAADGTGGKPFLVKNPDDGATWEEIELEDLSADCSAIAVAGNYLLIASGATINQYSKSGELQSTYTASGDIGGLHAIDAANVIAVGAGGLLLVSEDGGSKWATLNTGLSTALSAIASRHVAEWYVGGATGTLLRYRRGVLSVIALPSELASYAVNAIALPDSPAGFSREEDIYVGMSNGQVWSSDDNGDTWAQIAHPLSASGAITDLRFVEFLGQVLYVLHTDAGGASTLMRDWSGGAGGNTNVEIIDTPENSGHAVMTVAGANDAYLFGNVHGGDDLIVKVE